jgi:hypothetical protein
VELLLTPLLAAHLVAMNVAGAGPIVALWFERKEAAGDALAGRCATWLAKVGLASLVAGGLLGTVLGALLWTPNYADLWLGPMRYKAAWAIGEYAFSLVLGVAYLVGRNRFATRWRVARCVLLLLSGTNLLYHFPVLFSVATTVYFADLPSAAALSAAEFRQWMMRPEVLSRALHVVVASFAVTGVALMFRAATVESNDDRVRLARWGAHWALWTSLLQLPIGLWLLMSLPGTWQARAMGEDPIATGMLLTSLVLSFFLLQDLASIVFGEVQLRLSWRTLLLMALVVLLMTGTLRRIRPTGPVITAGVIRRESQDPPEIRSFPRPHAHRLAGALVQCRRGAACVLQRCELNA